MIRTFLERQALGHNRLVSLYRRFGRPYGTQWAAYLQRHGGLYHLGKDCSILPSTRIVDPPLTSIGDRVQLGNCTLLCHDGAIAAISHRHKLKLDRVGALVIEDDVFIGEGAIVMASGGKVVIGEGSVIGAGAVVRQSIPAGSIVTGNPAKVVGKVEDMLRFWEADTLAWPWGGLIASREGAYDPAIEPELMRLRQIHFFGKAADRNA